MQFLVVLSYFNRKIGPTVFYSFPKKRLNEEDTAIVPNLMDQIISEGFFTYSFNSSYTLNYYFEIDSEWARANKDLLMISIIFKESPSTETEKAVFTLCIEFTEWLKSKEKVFTAFYENTNLTSLNNPKEIKNNKILVKAWIKEFYIACADEIQEKLEEDNIITLLEKKDTLEILKLLSNNPMPINSLKKWYLETFPHRNFHKIISNLYKYHLVNIPKIGGRKNPPFNVYITKEVKPIINLVVLKNRLIKKFIKTNFKEPSNSLEKYSEEFHEFLKNVISEEQVV